MNIIFHFCLEIALNPLHWTFNRLLCVVCADFIALNLLE